MSTTPTVTSDKITPERVAKVAQLADDDPAAVRAFLEDNFELFANVVTYRWLDPKPEDWYQYPPHGMDWHRHFHEGNYTPMILAGRKHTKTTWVLCEILYHHQYIDHFRTLYWCNNATNQLPARMAELEEMIEANLWLDNLHKGNPNNHNNIPRSVSEKQFPNGSTLYGTGVGGGIEGSHVNMVIGDDPLKEMGDVGDEAIMEFYLNVIVPMASGADRSVIVGTRKRPKDIYHLIRERTADLQEFDIQGYRLIEYPAIREPWTEKYGDRMDHLTDASYTEYTAGDLADPLGLQGDTVSVLWPEGRGTDFLLGKLARQGKASFVREFCMVFTHVEGAIIPRDLIEDTNASINAPAPDTRKEAEAFLADYHNLDAFEFDQVSIGMDVAVVEGGDNTAWAVIGERDGTRYVLHVSYDDGIHPDRMRRTTKELYERYEADIIVPEKNGFEWYLDQHVQFDDHLPIQMHNTGKAKHSWTRGVPAIAEGIESGVYRFFIEDDGIEQLVDGLCSLRMDDNDHLAGHTSDEVMALYMAIKGFEKGNLTSSRKSMRGKTEQDREREQSNREKRQALKGTPFEGVGSSDGYY